MTDRLKGLVVTFENDTREDDAEETINAIGQIKGVLDVQPLVSDIDTHIAEVRVKNGLREKLFKVLE